MNRCIVLRWKSLVVLLVLLIVWYIEIFSRFFTIPNALLLLGGLLCVFLFFDYVSGGRQQIGEVSSTIPIYVIYLFMSLFFGCVTSPNVSAHVSQWIQIVEYFIVFIAIYYCAKRDEGIELFIWNYAIMYGLMCIIFFISPVYYRGEEFYDRLTYAENMNPNSFGIGMATGIWALLLLVSQKKIKMFVALPLCIMELYAIFLSGSRKAIIGAAMVIVFWVFLCYIPGEHRKIDFKAIVKFGAVVGVCVIVALWLVPLYLNSNLALRMEGLSEEMTDGARNHMYVMGMKYLKESPLFGIGFNGFKHYYGVYSHSTLVEVIVSNGIIIGSLYFIWYFVILKKLCVGARWAKQEGSYSAIVQARMSIIMFAVMMFYTIAMIHVYEIESYMMFGVLVASSDLVFFKRRTQYEV